jgi:hypothetical protein
VTHGKIKELPHGILIIFNNIKGVQVKVYLSSCYFFIIPFPFHFKDDF